MTITTKIGLFLLIIFAVIGLRFYQWDFEQRYPSTQDSYINAYVVSVTSPFTGKIGKIYAHNHSYVKRGDPLFDLDSKSYELAVSKIQTQLNNDKRNLYEAEREIITAERYIQETQQRISEMAKAAFQNQYQGAYKENLETAKEELEAGYQQLQLAYANYGPPNLAESKIKAGEKQLAAARLNLALTHIAAPANGYIGNMNLKMGDAIKANKPLFTLVENNEWWIEAKFKKNQSRRIRVNQPATVKITGQPVQRGFVENIQTKGNTTFVKIKLTNPKLDSPLKVGAHSIVSINTNP